MWAHMKCPCGSQLNESDCCDVYISGKKLPPTPEALMRSRYTAHVKVAVPYLKETLAPESRTDFSDKDVREWAEKSEWLGLDIQSAKGDTVEFTAKYRADGKTLEHHEIAQFKKIKDRWYFVDGDSHVHEEGQGHHHHAPMVPIVRESPKLGRNDPCVCGSGKKSKKCCAA
jgi:SEC-C motif-containing protein